VDAGAHASDPALDGALVPWLLREVPSADWFLPRLVRPSRAVWRLVAPAAFVLNRTFVVAVAVRTGFADGGLRAWWERAWAVAAAPVAHARGDAAAAPAVASGPPPLAPFLSPGDERRFFACYERVAARYGLQVADHRVFVTTDHPRVMEAALAALDSRVVVALPGPVVDVDAVVEPLQEPPAAGGAPPNVDVAAVVPASASWLRTGLADATLDAAAFLRVDVPGALPARPRDAAPDADAETASEAFARAVVKAFGDLFLLQYARIALCTYGSEFCAAGAALSLGGTAGPARDVGDGVAATDPLLPDEAIAVVESDAAQDAARHAAFRSMRTVDRYVLGDSNCGPSRAGGEPRRPCPQPMTPPVCDTGVW
jgi:hypothetical protein